VPPLSFLLFELEVVLFIELFIQLLLAPPPSPPLLELFLRNLKLMWFFELFKPALELVILLNSYLNYPTLTSDNFRIEENGVVSSIEQYNLCLWCSSLHCLPLFHFGGISSEEETEEEAEES